MSFFPGEKLRYAETHFKFRLPWSLLYRPWPEILADAPFQFVPGEEPTLWIVVRDAHRFPTLIEKMEIQMAGAEGVDLIGIDALALQISGVDVGLDVPFDDIRFDIFGKVLKYSLQCSGLSRSGGSHFVYHQYAVVSHMFFNVIGDGIVLIQYARLHVQFSYIVHCVPPFIFYYFYASNRSQFDLYYFSFILIIHSS